MAVPTETVYGLAADATNETAVRKIFSVKGRPLLDPLIVHVGDIDSIASICELPPEAHRLATAFWPGPLTLVLPRKADSLIPNLVSAGKPTLAVRIPGHPVLRKLLKESGLFLAAPSANPFGYVSPTRPEHVEASLMEGIDALLDGGPCEHGVESTIVSLLPGEGLRLLRPGPIAPEQIEHICRLSLASVQTERTANPTAPGMLKSHYRPTKGIHLFSIQKPPTALKNAEAIVFLKRPKGTNSLTFWLSENGDSREIAHNLFDLLRKLDLDSRVNKVWVENPETDDGVLRAIRDRLIRAATSPD